MNMRVVLVTGAASGIGAACARRLAAPGVAVLVHTRKNAEGAERVAAAVRERGGEATVMLGDIADPALPAALVERAVETFGGLDVVVSAAGFADRTPFSRLEDATLTRSLDGMSWAFLRLARAALPRLIGRPAPRVVAISSFVAHVFRADLATFPASAAAKAALEAMVRALAVEAAPHGITANAVAPGYTLKDPGAHSSMTAAQWDEVKARIPLRRLGTPEEVAAMVAFLASADAGYVTGQVIHVSGGLV